MCPVRSITSVVGVPAMGTTEVKSSVIVELGSVTLDFTSVVPIAGTPTTLVIDRTGHIAGAVFGSTTYPELTTILAKVTGKAADEAVSR
jgi:hypothetical protein